MRIAAAGWFLVLVATGASALEPVKSVVVQSEVPFSNIEAMDSAIVAECQLPKVQHDFLMRALSAAGIQGQAVADAKPGSGDAVLLMEIAQASSQGNAWSGHNKSMTVTGKLFQGGQQVARFVATRNTRGGMGAGFKGSCAVLARCAEAIGRDTAKWLGNPVDGAKLGDAR